MRQLLFSFRMITAKFFGVRKFRTLRYLFTSSSRNSSFRSCFVGMVVLGGQLHKRDQDRLGEDRKVCLQREEQPR